MSIIINNKQNIQRWITSGIEKETVNFANKVWKGEENKSYVNSLSNSQIRNVFGEMRRIQMTGFENNIAEFLLLKPKMAYAVKRHKDSKGLNYFYELFSTCYDAVDTQNPAQGKKHFNNMMQLMEAVLAYHKYHGGKE